jgi:hypothetical protein
MHAERIFLTSLDVNLGLGNIQITCCLPPDTETAGTL